MYHAIIYRFLFRQLRALRRAHAPFCGASRAARAHHSTEL
jgi:hypothetical protein